MYIDNVSCIRPHSIILLDRIYDIWRNLYKINFDFGMFCDYMKKDKKVTIY